MKDDSQRSDNSEPQPGIADQSVGTPASYKLRLYIAGLSFRSTEAVNVVKMMCEEQLPGQYELEVIDIYQHPELARQGQVVAVPTLVRESPPPLRRLIGNLANRERLLTGLDIQRRGG